MHTKSMEGDIKVQTKHLTSSPVGQMPIYVLFVYLFLYIPVNSFFSHVGTGLTGFNQ